MVRQKQKQELKEIEDALNTETSSFAELFKPGLRTALIIGIILSIFSQVTGINAIMYYAPEIFKSTGDGSGSALLQTILVGVVNLLFTLVAIKYVDKAGRKGLLLAGSAGMAICLAIVGFAFYFDAVKGYLVLIAILAYIACFALSFGPLTFVVIAEIFPNRDRGRAMSICFIFSLDCSVLCFPIFPDVIRIYWKCLYVLDIYGYVCNCVSCLYGRLCLKQKEKRWKKLKRHGIKPLLKR